jgi:hypothetical protein
VCRVRFPSTSANRFAGDDPTKNQRRAAGERLRRTRAPDEPEGARTAGPIGKSTEGDLLGTTRHGIRAEWNAELSDLLGMTSLPTAVAKYIQSVPIEEVCFVA